MSQTVVMKIVANTEEAEKNIKNVKKEVEQANKATTELASAFDQATGGFISKGKGAIATVQNLGKGFLGAGSSATKMGNLIKIALTSTGIGALLVAFGSLLTFFTKTQEGADKLKQVFAGFNAGVSAVIDRVSSLGESLTKLFSGDFSGALETAKGAFRGLGDEIQREVNIAIELEKVFQRIRDREIELIVSSSQLRKEIELDKLVAEDRNKTFEDRIAALDRVLENENKLLEAEKAIAIEKRDALEAELDLSKSTAEEREAVAQAQARVNDLEAQSATRQKEAFTRRQALLQEAQTAEDNAIKEQFRLRNEFNKAVELVDDNAIGRFKAKVQLETTLYKQGLTEQIEAYQDAKQKESKVEKLTSDQKLAIASQSLGQIANLLGENSKFGKGLAVTQAVIDTFAGANKALAQGGIFGGIAAAGVIATGLANVKTILSTQEPSRPSFVSGGRGQASVPSVPAAPPSFNVVGTSPESQLAQAIGGQAKEPIKAYVVAGEVTTAQSLERNTIKEASI